MLKTSVPQQKLKEKSLTTLSHGKKHRVWLTQPFYANRWWFTSPTYVTQVMAAHHWCNTSCIALFCIQIKRAPQRLGKFLGIQLFVVPEFRWIFILEALVASTAFTPDIDNILWLINFLRRGLWLINSTHQSLWRKTCAHNRGHGVIPLSAGTLDPLYCNALWSLPPCWAALGR